MMPQLSTAMTYDRNFRFSYGNKSRITYIYKTGCKIDFLTFVLHTSYLTFQSWFELTKWYNSSLCCMT